MSRFHAAERSWMWWDMWRINVGGAKAAIFHCFLTKYKSRFNRIRLLLVANLEYFFPSNQSWKQSYTPHMAAIASISTNSSPSASRSAPCLRQIMLSDYAMRGSQPVSFFFFKAAHCLSPNVLILMGTSR